MRVEPVLEFEALRDLLARYVRSTLGREELKRVAPSSNREEIEEALADAAEATLYLGAASEPQTAARGAAIRIRFEDIPDLGTSVQRLRIEGATLEGREIYELSRLMELASDARSILTAAVSRFPRLAAHASGIADLGDVANELRGKVLPDGGLADHASAALTRLRRDLERQRKLIHESLERFLRSHREDGTLQEDFVTIRNDRFVVPVIAGKERRVDGVIHSASGSGHTLFLEPLETINLNNEAVRLQEEELREVHRLLRDFTARLRVHAVEIAAMAAALGRLDLIFSKGQFAIDFACSVPKLSEAGVRRLELREARHPLLEDLFRTQRKKVVPVSLTLDAATRTLLISGPNTGGKTVALKTVGLLALMAHAGLPIPAAAGEFPLFDQVLADIGDHQSIAESLSTFSAHIAAIRDMLERATADSLVLIDELGRATDPDEGGALGVAVLDALGRRGAFILASTHLIALKIYGASSKGVLNSSMGFDDQTLDPTYVLRLGAPGKSAGLDIAGRLGLDPELIEAARSRMTTAGRDVADFLAELHRRIEAVDAERREVQEREEKLRAREASLEKDWERKYSTKIREVERQAETLAADFERRAGETIGELSQKARARVAKTRREYSEAVESLVPRPAVTGAAPVAPKIVEGSSVRLKGVRQPARVRRLLHDGMLEVEAGFLRMQVSIGDVEEVLGEIAAQTKPSNMTFRQGPSFEGSYREINVIGQRAENAMEQVDKLLDSAALAQVERVRIVHGHGMGILKKVIGELLKDNPHVQKFYPAAQEEGGSGATIVEMKT